MLSTWVDAELKEEEAAAELSTNEVVTEGSTVSVGTEITTLEEISEVIVETSTKPEDAAPEISETIDEMTEIIEVGAALGVVFSSLDCKTEVGTVGVDSELVIVLSYTVVKSLDSVWVEYCVSMAVIVARHGFVV